MDSIRFKFKYENPNTSFFEERIHQKELQLTYISGGRFAWTNNTWRRERQESGLYTPKYWIEQDFKFPEITYFCLETSLPKLINAENLTALKTNQLDEAVKAISNFCQVVGVYIFPDQIRRCVPTLVAFGKNINITNLCACNYAIKALKPFDYKTNCQHRIVDFTDKKHGGKEAIFSQSSETFKAYDKKREILNRAETTKEKETAELMQQGLYRIDGQLASEILRVELTLKTERKIRSKLKPYLGELAPTFENLFNEKLWEKVLKDEVNAVFNHPLQRIIFLALEGQHFIDEFLDKHYHHIQTKDTIRGMLASLQRSGFAETRKDYLGRYRSRQTWYNYLRRLKELQKHFDWSALGQLDNVKIHSFILKQFGIITETQQELGLNFNTRVSKKIDTKQRNT